MRWVIRRRTGATAVLLAGAVLVASGVAGGAPTGTPTALNPAVSRQATVAEASLAAGSAVRSIDDYRECANPANYPSAPIPASAYLAGYSDAAKEGESLPTGFPSLALASSQGPGEGLLEDILPVNGVPANCLLARLQLQNGEFPPTRATFLAYGFEPVTATVQLTQIGSSPLQGVLYAGGPSKAILQEVSTAEMSLRVSDVDVNGVPLNVGSDCHTVRPVFTPDPEVDPANDLLVLTGGMAPSDPQPPINLLHGGTLAGTVTIPPFTGCTGASGENLNPLITASVSGPGNYVRISQGALCQPPAFCVGTSLTPSSQPLWTIKDGGNYNGTGPLTINGGTAAAAVTVTCTTSKIGGTVPNATGPPRGPQATFAWTEIGGCSGTLTTIKLQICTVNGHRQICRIPTTTPYGTWTVTAQNGPGAFYIFQDGVAEGNLFNISVHVTGSDLPDTPASCAFDATDAVSAGESGSAELDYDNSTTTFALSGELAVTDSTCSKILAGTGQTVSLVASESLNLPVSIVSP